MPVSRINPLLSLHSCFLLVLSPPAASCAVEGWLDRSLRSGQFALHKQARNTVQQAATMVCRTRMLLHISELCMCVCLSTVKYRRCVARWVTLLLCVIPPRPALGREDLSPLTSPPHPHIPTPTPHLLLRDSFKLREAVMPIKEMDDKIDIKNYQRP